ncbi:MAG TPA: mannitol dehydrogenase family protein [Lachnospiraceae bacterium]|nr:mannitol dehydrogenase family protein [Lachnospiraceae bacterium]
MKLNEVCIKEHSLWESKGYTLPKFDRQKVESETKQNPFWIHFGAGNIFRAFQANVVQNLLNTGVVDRGLVVAEGFDYEIIDKMYRPQDNLGILVTLKSNGSIEKTVVGSVVESLCLDSSNQIDFARLKEIFEKDSLQMVSFTITEKGYNLIDGKGDFIPSVLSDMKSGPKAPTSYMGKVCSLLYARFLSGEKPIAMVSMDNCSHNGSKLYSAVTTLVNTWNQNDLVSDAFVNYIKDSSKVSFPWSMIDKITPRPNESVKEILQQDTIENLDPIITSKNTFIAPFVNAEECEYLVIEDAFPNGRPPLEKAGIIFTDRDTVDKVEKMKVCTCLNPLHTALAVFGCLLGYDLIADEMKDSTLKALVEKIGYEEGLPVVVDPGIINPKVFLDTVLTLRIPNPFMPDTPQRIATDTSQKLAIRFGETIKAYEQSETLQVKDLKLIPLVFAGWLRYLMAIDDQGKPFTLSPDPLLDTLCPYVSDIHLGDHIDADKLLAPILKNPSIFGVNLFEVNMAGEVCGYFREMTTGIGAVRQTLEKYVYAP